MMKRTLLALGISAMLAMPLMASGQMTPSTPGTGSGPATGTGSSGTRMEQGVQGGQMDARQGDIRQAQERLKDAGFNPGPADGQLGTQTKEALKEYQKAHGLPQTGELDDSTRELLMVQKTDAAPGGRQSPGGYRQEGIRPGEAMPGSRAPQEPGTGSTLPGGSSSGR
jgi:peptidoglycan hydrolase-like protein with peptidoglycan-binding domain